MENEELEKKPQTFKEMFEEYTKEAMESRKENQQTDEEQTEFLLSVLKSMKKKE